MIFFTSLLKLREHMHMNEKPIDTKDNIPNEKFIDLSLKLAEKNDDKRLKSIKKLIDYANTLNW